MQKPTAADLAKILGSDPCLRYDQKGSIICQAQQAICQPQQCTCLFLTRILDKQEFCEGCIWLELPLNSGSLGVVLALLLSQLRRSPISSSAIRSRMFPLLKTEDGMSLAASSCYSMA